MPTPEELLQLQMAEAARRQQYNLPPPRGPYTEAVRPGEATWSGPLLPTPLAQRLAPGYRPEAGRRTEAVTEDLPLPMTYSRPVNVVGTPSGAPASANPQYLRRQEGESPTLRGGGTRLRPEYMEDVREGQRAAAAKALGGSLENQIRASLPGMPAELQSFYKPSFSLGGPNANIFIDRLMRWEGLDRAAAERLYTSEVYPDIMGGLGQPVTEHPTRTYFRAPAHTTPQGEYPGHPREEWQPPQPGISYNPRQIAEMVGMYREYGEEGENVPRDVGRHEGGHAIGAYGGLYKNPRRYYDERQGKTRVGGWSPELAGGRITTIDDPNDEFTFMQLKRVFPFLEGGGAAEHYQRSPEIFTNMVHSIAEMGRPFTAQDIDTMRAGYWPGAGIAPEHASSDILEAVNDPMTTATNQEIADALNLAKTAPVRTTGMRKRSWMREGN